MAGPTRPALLELRTDSQMSIPRPMRSPRLHVAGEIPPELSPLDAFALQSRLLAKQLEESARTGNRLSRLPPLTTESPLIVQGRSEYFRSLSLESASELDDAQQHLTGPGMRPEVEESPIRPQSMHPRMSQIPPTPDAAVPPLPTNNAFEAIRGRTLAPLSEKSSYFGARREHSPSSFSSASIDAKLAEDDAQSTRSMDAELLEGPPTISAHAVMIVNKRKSQDSLAPPVSGFPRRSSSIVSQSAELGVEEALASSYHSSQGSRKMSTSSASIFSPHQQRSPSISSNISELPRPAFNFSRPMSRAGTPGPATPGLEARFEAPVRQTSTDSHSSFFAEDVHTPISMNSETFPDVVDDGRAGAPSYIYSKYSLPRGKLLSRNSIERSQPGATLLWEQHSGQTRNLQPIPFGGQAPPSPPTRPSSSGGKAAEGMEASLEVPRPSTQPSPSNSQRSVSEERTPQEIARTRSQDRPSTATASDASTIKAKSQHSTAATTMAEISADEHVDKAVALHEEGKYNESTYHLRYAAKQGHPTGMLLYALACRHGWGMRPNQEEGVRWLRLAADSAGTGIAEDEDKAKQGQNVDRPEQKKRKAQLALSIYELGASYMNGWGIEQDKALALRCYEIAGTWGDVDALAEAGFCYAQGVGCKKNLKKAAKFYRMAEAKGMSMVGQSWIHKSKYDDSDDDDKKSTKSSKSTRSKSRSRNFLGLSKTRSNTTTSSYS
ncbi:hypothetical protein BD289DRAFT_358911 [Coniella lustricola]|uniref:HCP-like protein n=1 Tax=Coniella lustricola TaxID=2025994 RepID=A0A2T3AMZ6_9PEZI|nr:hypothetical protein BD289DRAFT_358911 [Coniella lustricola]